nr:replication initiation protein [uncultured Butyrivibrio sp.]
MLEHDQETAIAKEITQYKKSNFFINAKTKRTLSEEKVLAIAMQRIQTAPEVDGNIVCAMKANELRNLFNDESGSLYSHLDQIANRFMDNGMIGFKDAENNKFDYLHVVTRAKYEDGIFTLKFNGDLKKHLIGMSKNYTFLELSIMMNFDSVYSFRVYEIIKSREYTLNYKKEVPCTSYEMEFNLNEFKFQIGVADVTEPKVKEILSGSVAPDWDRAIKVCENQKYRDWRNFKRSVINVVEKEITEKTDLNLVIDTDSLKGGKGGKIYGIKLCVTPKANSKKEVKLKEETAEVVKKTLTDDEKLEYIEKIIEMIDEKITMKEARAILDACEYDIDKVKKNYSIAKKQGKIRNLIGWLIDACVNEYSKPIEIDEVPANQTGNKFNNFEQAKYSKKEWEEIEKQLLDN